MNVVITGSSKGLGKAIAISLARKNYNLFIHSRSESDLEQLKNELLEINSEIKVYYFACDISVRTQVDTLIKSILTVFREVDILINNAGNYLGVRW